MGPVNTWALWLLKCPRNTQNSNKNKQQMGGGWGWEKKGANLVEEHRKLPGVTAPRVCGEGGRAGSQCYKCAGKAAGPGVTAPRVCGECGRAGSWQRLLSTDSLATSSPPHPSHWQREEIPSREQQAAAVGIS